MNDNNVDKKIIYIDVGNIPSHLVDDYMKKVLNKCKDIGPKTKWQKFKKWFRFWLIN